VISILLASVAAMPAVLAGCDATSSIVFESAVVSTSEGGAGSVEVVLAPQSVFDEAAKYIGLAEVEGNESNPIILDMLDAVGIRGDNLTDSTAWCGAYVNHVLESLGLPSPKSALARAYLDVGFGVPVTDAVPGDVVTIWRESISSWKGHVGFVHNIDLDSGMITILAGNQGNMVRIETYPLSRVLAIRRVV